MENKVKKKVEFLNFYVKKLNNTQYNKKEILDLFNELKNEDKNNLKDSSVDSNDFSFLTIYETFQDKIYGMLINQDAENKLEIGQNDKLPTKITDLTIANITFFCIYCIEKDSTGVDRYVFFYMRNEHGPSYTKLIEILNQKLADNTVIFEPLVDKEILNRIGDDSAVYQLSLSLRGPVDKYMDALREKDISFDKELSRFGAKKANLDIYGGDLRKRKKVPIKNIIGIDIKSIAQRYSEDNEFRENLDSFVVKLSTTLVGIETIDFVKNRIEDIIHINHITENQTPKNYIDYVFDNLFQAFVNNKEKIKKNYLF